MSLWLFMDSVFDNPLVALFNIMMNLQYYVILKIEVLSYGSATSYTSIFLIIISLMLHITKN